MDYGRALTYLQEGACVRRELWAEDQFIFLVNGSTFTVNRAPLDVIFPQGTKVEYYPHLDMCFGVVVGSPHIETWAPSTADQLADDWSEVSLHDIAGLGIVVDQGE